MFHNITELFALHLENVSLVRLREAAGVNQAYMSRVAGVSQPTISYGEKRSVPDTRAPLYYHVFFEERGFQDPLPVLMPEAVADPVYDPRDILAFTGQSPRSLLRMRSRNLEGLASPSLEHIQSFLDCDGRPHYPNYRVCYAVLAALTTPARIILSLSQERTGVESAAIRACNVGVQLLIKELKDQPAFQRAMLQDNVDVHVVPKAPFDPLTIGDPMFRQMQAHTLKELEGDEQEAQLRTQCVRCFRPSPVPLTQPWTNETYSLSGYLCEDCVHVVKA